MTRNWKVSRLESGPRGGGGGLMLTFDTPTDFVLLPDSPKMRSVAEFIVRSANSHDELVEALVLALSCAKHVADTAAAILAKAEAQ